MTILPLWKLLTWLAWLCAALAVQSEDVCHDGEACDVATGNSHQLLQVRQMKNKINATEPSLTVTLKNIKANQCLGFSLPLKEYGNITLQACHGGANQQWLSDFSQGSQSVKFRSKVNQELCLSAFECNLQADKLERKKCRNNGFKPWKRFHRNQRWDSSNYKTSHTVARIYRRSISALKRNFVAMPCDYNPKARGLNRRLPLPLIREWKVQTPGPSLLFQPKGEKACVLGVDVHNSSMVNSCELSSCTEKLPACEPFLWKSSAATVSDFWTQCYNDDCFQKDYHTRRREHGRDGCMKYECKQSGLVWDERFWETSPHCEGGNYRGKCCAAGKCSL